MRARPGLLRLLCVALLAVAAPATGQDTPLGAHVDGMAEAFMTRDRVPGAIVAVVSGDETILRGYGVTDIAAGTRAGPDDVRFEIGSVTKLFTWVVVMRLVEDGRLDLRADVSSYLRDVRVPGTAPLTLAQLMSHRPGFAESYDIFFPETAGLPRAEALTSAAPDQVFPRGRVTSYSNWGVALAGHVVEAVTGETWEDVVQTRLLDPLGMENTTLAEGRRRADQPPLSQSYRIRGGLPVPAYRVDIGAFAPAGGIASTAADMARFLRFLMGDGSLDGVRVLAPETMARMRTRLFDDRPGAADMAHGLQAKPRFGTTVYGHGGGLNEFVSNLLFLPEIGAGVFVSQNGGAGAGLPLVAPDLILATLAAEAGLAAPPPRPVPDAEARAAEAAGRYVTNRRTFSGPAQVLAALSPLEVAALPGGALLLPTGISPMPSRFTPVAPDIWQDAQGHRIAVLRDETGQVVRLADGSGAQTHERVRGLADPVWLWASLGLAAVLSVTTLMGLVWRHGLAGGGRLGTLAAGLATAGAVSVWVFVGTAVGVGLGAVALGGEYLFDQPQPTLRAFLMAGKALAILAATGLLAAGLIWWLPGWTLWRRLHQSAFALALASFAAFLLRWGLAFGGPI